MARYFFSLGLVPVQSWIAEARRSRDLKAGSVFLWHLMAGLLAELPKPAVGATIHLPPEGQPSFAELAGLPFGAALKQRYGIPNRASGSCKRPATPPYGPPWSTWRRSSAPAGRS